MNNLPISEDLLDKIHTTFDTIIQFRGEPNQELDQYYLTKESSLQRAFLLKPNQYTGKRIILLGDMDLTSLCIGLISKPRDLAVLDIDKRLPEIVFKMKFDHKIRTIRFINHDYRLRTIAILKDQFDYIFVEPPMTKDGLELGLSRAVQCAKKDDTSRIFLSVDLKAEKNEFIKSLIHEMKLEIIEEKKDFNQYEYQTPLSKNTSDMYILRVKDNSEETISHHYLGPAYYREVGNYPYPYLCKCGDILLVGEGGDFASVEDLQNKGCPKCQYNDKFLYNSSIKIE